MQTQTLETLIEMLPGEALQTDEELMSRYAEGDAEAFDILFQRHKGSVYAFIRRFMASSDLADDLFQTVFMRIIQCRQRYRPTAKFSTWLFTITRSVCIDAMRKRKRMNRFLLIPIATEPNEEEEAVVAISQGPSPRQILQENEMQRVLEEVIATLPEEQREVLLLREMTALTFAEIGEMIGCPVNTVKSRMHYALLALRRELTERGIESL